MLARREVVIGGNVVIRAGERVIRAGEIHPLANPKIS